MLIKRSASYPHPILADATGDYENGIFNLALDGNEDSGTGHITLHGKMTLEEPSILDMLESRAALSGIMIHCQDTYLDRFLPHPPGDLEINFKNGEVRGRVVIRGVVIANQDNIRLSASKISKEFTEDSKLLGCGDLVAMTPELHFEAGFEKMTQMESIFRLVRSEEEKEELFQLDLSEENILILVPPTLYDLLGTLRGTPFKDVLLPALYLPVVISVLHAMQAHNEDYSDRRWYSVLDAKCEAYGIDVEHEPPFLAAQRLLNAPLGLLHKTYEKLGGA